MKLTSYKLPHLILTAILALMAVPAIAVAAANSDAVMQPIHQFIDGMNANDNTKAAAAFTATATLIDEFPPYYWHSATAYADWGSSFAAEAAKQSVTEPHITMATPSHVQMEGQAAYVVIPADFKFKVKGAAQSEAGLFTFTVKRHNGVWKINSMTWSTK